MAKTHSELILIATLILLFIGIPQVQDVLDKPEVRFVAQYEEESYPQSLHFPDYRDRTADFKIGLQNTGGDGDIWMSISSEHLLSKSSDMDQFNHSATKEWYLNSKDSTNYNFKIKLNMINGEEPENVTIEILTGCYEEVWGMRFNGKTIKNCCSYNRTKREGYYELIGKSC